MDATVAVLSAPLEGAGQGGVVTTHLQHSALLSLGSMARMLTQQNQEPALADEITDILGSVLDHVTGHAPSSRLRRDIGANSANSDIALLRATVLDSIGNSGAERLFPRLVDHVSQPGSLAVKHAAVKAIARFESAEVSIQSFLLFVYCCCLLFTVCGGPPEGR